MEVADGRIGATGDKRCDRQIARPILQLLIRMTHGITNPTRLEADDDFHQGSTRLLQNSGTVPNQRLR